MSSSTDSEFSPIFIGGMFKSGTSLLRAMLGQHPNILAGLETYWFAINWTEKSTADWQEAVARIARFFDLPVAPTLDWAKSMPSAEHFLDRCLSDVARSAGKARWAEKTPGNIGQVDRILNFWPTAKILHIVRDPRDVYCSLVQAGKPISPQSFISDWKSVVLQGLLLAADPNLSGKLMSLRYEDLVLHPRETMRSVVSFVGEPWSEGIDVFEGSKADFDKVLQVTGKASSTLQRLKSPLETVRIGIWRDPQNTSNCQQLAAQAEAMGCGDNFNSAFYDQY